ncbi:MerR family transcriptional regulator [Longirhabdus pacifica]|uniref:MerR family transcriptional regulator n=1 Tax=Longirhabdus pacifica TaxID=2305227 RepID=UPI00100909FF|nr:MerR family transcriptional regulator [Longirhabdus pacifica]
MSKDLLRIGQLAKEVNSTTRTIDYYTSQGLLHPIKRSESNYRLYHRDSIPRFQRIEWLKKEKYSLEDIKTFLDQWDNIQCNSEIGDKIVKLEQHMRQLEKELKEIKPFVENLKPSQAKNVYKVLTSRSAACIEAIMLLLERGPMM